MTKLTSAQEALLRAAAAADDSIEPGEIAKPTIWSLIKRGLIVAADDTGRLSITAAGRQALVGSDQPEDAAPGPSETAETELMPVQPKAPTGKIAALVTLLRQEGGATIEAMMMVTGWQAHSVRGAISGAVKAKLGLTVASVKTDGVRVYRIVAGTAA